MSRCVSVAEFLKDLADHHLLSPEELRRAKELTAREQITETPLLARSLVQSGQLTRYQASKVLQGRAKELILGKYLRLDVLGAGGVGRVYKAVHRVLGRVVALKVVPPTATRSGQTHRRFLREIETLAKLRHPNIVAGLDADKALGATFLVTEFVDGMDLDTYVTQNGPLPVEIAIDFIVQAAEGLGYAHQMGVTHRDVKPANLLWERGTDRVKVLDLGLALLRGDHLSGDSAEQLTWDGQIAGSFDFMSPEQAHSLHDADARSDIYSLGCTLYFLLTGKPPFAADSAMNKLLAHREAPIPSLREARAEVPEPADEAFRRMVAKEPQDRFASMTEVITALAPRRERPDTILEDLRLAIDGVPSELVERPVKTTVANHRAHLPTTRVTPVSTEIFQPPVHSRKRAATLWILLAVIVACIICGGIVVSVR